MPLAKSSGNTPANGNVAPRFHGTNYPLQTVNRLLVKRQTIRIGIAINLHRHPNHAVRAGIQRRTVRLAENDLIRSSRDAQNTLRVDADDAIRAVMRQQHLPLMAQRQVAKIRSQPWRDDD